MKIAQINMVANGSTGKIMLQCSAVARELGNEVRTYSTIPFDKNNVEKMELIDEHYTWGSIKENKIHYYLGSIFGLNGFFSKKGTRDLIENIKNFDPDIIHLHNFHKFCLNIPMFFDFLRNSNAKIVWTLHDCWSFTGGCSYFDIAACEKWKTGCGHCQQLNRYPKSILDSTKFMYKYKKNIFTDIKNLTIVTPSWWMAKLVQQSFLKDYPIRVINNGIDLKVFKPTPSIFREKHNIPLNQVMLLGVAFDWGIRKGLDIFVQLSKILDDSIYRIVLIGTNDELDKKIPKNVISIHRTQNQTELAEIYSAADFFVNPTREDNFPTVNLEAIACGTPVITFNSGGSPECIDEKTGIVVQVNDVKGLVSILEKVRKQNYFSKTDCLKRANCFDKNDKFKEYIELYEDITYST